LRNEGVRDVSMVDVFLGALSSCVGACIVNYLGHIFFINCCQLISCLV
jgi:hypothetical protein